MATIPVPPAMRVRSLFTTSAVAAVVPIVNVTVAAVLLEIVGDVDGIEQVGAYEPDPPLTEQVIAACPMKPLAGVMVMVLVPCPPGLTVIAPLFDRAMAAPDGSSGTCSSPEMDGEVPLAPW